MARSPLKQPVRSEEGWVDVYFMEIGPSLDKIVGGTLATHRLETFLATVDDVMSNGLWLEVDPMRYIPPSAILLIKDRPK